MYQPLCQNVSTIMPECILIYFVYVLHSCMYKNRQTNTIYIYVSFVIPLWGSPIGPRCGLPYWPRCGLPFEQSILGGLGLAETVWASFEGPEKSNNRHERGPYKRSQIETRQVGAYGAQEAF